MSENNKSIISVLQKVLMVSITVVLPFALILPYALIIVFVLPLIFSAITTADVNKKVRSLDFTDIYSHKNIYTKIDSQIIYNYFFMVIVPVWIYINFFVLKSYAPLHEIYDAGYIRNNYVLDLIYDSFIGGLIKDVLPGSRASFYDYGYPALIVLITTSIGGISLILPCRISYLAHLSFGKVMNEDEKLIRWHIDLVILCICVAFLFVFLVKLYFILNHGAHTDYRRELHAFTIAALLSSLVVPSTISAVQWKIRAKKKQKKNTKK